MRDKGPGDAEDARIAGERPAGELRQLAVVARRQIVADLADLLVDDVEVVDQPLRGRGDRPFLGDRPGEDPVRLDQLPAGARAFDLAVMDVSFISVRQVLPAIVPVTSMTSSTSPTSPRVVSTSFDCDAPVSCSAIRLRPASFADCPISKTASIGVSDCSVQTRFETTSVAARPGPPGTNVQTRAPVGETINAVASVEVDSGAAVRAARSST